MDSFSQPVRRWFADSFPGLTRVQELGWPVLTRGRNALLVAPTGSGKTLAAFLWAIDRLSFDRPETCAEGVTREPGVRVLYVSPLKALVYDIDRNLEAPLVGVRRSARESGVPVRPVTVDVRTGDTTPQERRRQLRRPGEILVTTPESLFLILGSQAAANLRTVETVIVDEVHTMVATKRGAHLALSLERLAELTGDREPQRIGLSATVRPMDLAAEFLGGDRPVEVVDASAPPNIDLQVVVPVADMEAPPAPEALADGEDPPRGFETSGLWPSIFPRDPGCGQAPPVDDRVRQQPLPLRAPRAAPERPGGPGRPVLRHERPGTRLARPRVNREPVPAPVIGRGDGAAGPGSPRQHLPRAAAGDRGVSQGRSPAAASSPRAHSSWGSTWARSTRCCWSRRPARPREVCSAWAAPVMRSASAAAA